MHTDLKTSVHELRHAPPLAKQAGPAFAQQTGTSLASCSWRFWRSRAPSLARLAGSAFAQQTGTSLVSCSWRFGRSRAPSLARLATSLASHSRRRYAAGGRSAVKRVPSVRSTQGQSEHSYPSLLSKL
ncbi:hypothetical protein [Paenibacillus odorifer]|uniref:hypothetical protein n=1 Tax=Paenibacillus odorifer TaxID=189426 RepID=UPI0015C2E5C2|nr:hypothetical protein [Paenibacillus odorifer]